MNMCQRKTSLLCIVAFVASCLFIAVSHSAVHAAETAHRQLYQKKDTWCETILASRPMLAQYLKNLSLSRRQVQVSPWYVTAPIKTESFSDVLFPEKKVDLDALDDNNEPIWRLHPEYEDGRVHSLPELSPASTYLFRTITAKNPQLFVVGLGSNDGIEVWLNDRKIHSNNIGRSVAPDQDRVSLALRAGPNRLLLKIFNRGNACGFYFSLRAEPIYLIWQKFESDFPLEAAWISRDLAAGERLDLFAGSVDTIELEKKMITDILEGFGAICDNLRKDVRQLSDAKPPSVEQQWLKLYARACTFRENMAGVEQMNFQAIGRALAYLAENFPQQYPNSQQHLRRFDQFMQRFINIRKDRPEEETASTGGSEELTGFLAGLRWFQHQVFIAENPLLSFDKLLFVRRYTYQSSHYYTDYIDGCRLFGGNVCILDIATGQVTDLVPELDGGIFGRFDLSFDAKRIVFDYKSAIGKGFRIYEVGIDGKNLRQLTFDPPDEQQRIDKYWLRWHKFYRHHTDDMHPCYLPDGRIVFISTRCERGILCDAPDILTTTVLYRMDHDGSNMKILSAGSVSEEVPTVMNDGRILYTRWEYVDKGGSAVKCLWAMRPDGSGSVEIYGNDHAFPSFYNGRAIPNHNNLFAVIGGPHMPLGVGTVIRLDINYPIRTRKPMTYFTPEIDIRGEHGYHHLRAGRWIKDSQGPLFDDPYPLDDKFFLVSYNPDKDVHDKSAYGLYLLDEFGNRTLIYRDPKFSCFQPIPLRQHKAPVLPSILPTAPLGEPATVMVNDVYVGLDGVKRGTIKYLRIMEQVPRPWAARRFWDGDTLGQQHSVISRYTHTGLKVMHGIVPVEKDGSAQFTVPSGKNIFFQALDEDFMEVQRMRTFVEFKPGEKRSCVGCHELRQLAPANKAVIAMRRRPDQPAPQPGDTEAQRPIYYPTDVQPILDKHCIKCHSGSNPKTRLDLTGQMTDLFNRSYESILDRKLVKVVDEIGSKMGNVEATGPYTWGSHASRLVKIIRQGHENVKLSRPEFIKLVTWVDSNAQYYGSYFGRKNLKYKDHPNFRPDPTFASASGKRPIKAEKDR